ncbi:MAG: serine O-acetyltransferase [Proteobacteria bacterium]|nr:serine O-acetyltransferase [Pseudomonadota bacterium]
MIFRYIFQDSLAWNFISGAEKIKHFFSIPGYRAVVLYRMARYFHLKKWFIFSKLLHNINYIVSNVEISLEAEIGEGFRIAHPSGVVIGKMRCGNGLTVFSGVVIGARRIGEGKEGKYAVMGDNIIIYSGAKIIGDIKVGDSVIIAANSVVLESVPDNKTVAGIPAKVIHHQ